MGFRLAALRYKTEVKVAEENKLFSSFQKKILSSFLGLTRRAQNDKPGHSNLSPFPRYFKRKGVRETLAPERGCGKYTSNMAAKEMR